MVGLSLLIILKVGVARARPEGV